MTPLRPFLTLAARLWYALDTANAVRHGNPISDRARAHCLSDHTLPAPARVAATT